MSLFIPSKVPQSLTNASFLLKNGNGVIIYHGRDLLYLVREIVIKAFTRGNPCYGKLQTGFRVLALGGDLGENTKRCHIGTIREADLYQCRTIRKVLD